MQRWNICWKFICATTIKFFIFSFWSLKIYSVTDSCTGHSHGSMEPVPMTHTFGLHEIPVTRSLLSIGWPSLRPLIWLAACGDGPWCLMKQWKGTTFPFFWFCCCFLSPSIFTLCFWLEKSTGTIFSLYIRIHPLPPSMDVWSPWGQHVIHCVWQLKLKVII